MPKQRKVFAMQNFLGLDKENKPLKVAPFRASDGYNFEIDSLTLKTRKGFVVDQYIKADMASGDSVVEWYEYQNTTFYVTQQSFYVVDGDTTTNLKTGNNVVSAGISTLINTNKNPIFREEKNALFIFGLDAILVFSIIKNDDDTVNKYVIYDLKTKPGNPYDVNDAAEVVLHETFEELPKPYEPTLFIGDTPFEDVNLLSNVNKYRLFANKTTEDGFVKYILPTAYDAEKNGDVQTIIDTAEIVFYKDKFENLVVFPIFLGIDAENFTYDSNQYGSSYLASNVDVQDTFYPTLEFEKFKDYTQNPPVITDTITAIYGLTKNDFFNFRIKNTSQTVFEYLLNLIKTGGNAIQTNKVVKFNLPVEYTLIYRPDTDYSTMQEKIIERDVVEVYVQLRRYDNQDFVSTDVASNIEISSTLDVLASSTSYVSYPSISGTYDTTIELAPSAPGVAVNNTQFTNQAVEIIQDWVNANKQNYQTEINNDENGEYYLRIHLDLYYPYTNQINPFVNITQLNYVTAAQGQESYPPYPTYSNPNSYPVQTVSTLFSAIEYYPGQEAQIQADLDSHLTSNIGFYFSGYTNGYGFVRYQYRLYSSLVGDFIYVSAIALVEFQKNVTESRQIRAAAASIVKLTIESQESSLGLYDLSYNSESNWFELSVRDYFFDYNAEPSIDVKFTFPLNPDYELISKNKFGIFFGSEDRLFLAGHPDYPNIDRYNVSNDLLGDNIVNQSYELSYFPSKNYRVLGGKGKINGYVVATDTQLYITKENYPNDSKLFIRERVLDENGIAYYKEFKTSVTETPINEKCLVRFYNDILILTKNGLYGVEISSNVLTNERLLKLRSGFINKHLKEVISQTQSKNIFIQENNQLMFIFIGKNIYVADSRYISKNENSEIENLSYELVRWVVPEQFVHATFQDNVLQTIAEGSEVRLKLEEADEDIVAEYEANLFVNSESQSLFASASVYDAPWIQIQNPTKAQETFENFSKSSIYLPNELNNIQVILKKNTDITYNSRVGGLVTLNIVNNSTRTAQLDIGDKLYNIDADDEESFGDVVVKQLNESTIVVETTDAIGQLFQDGSYNKLGIDASFKTLYPVIAFKDGSNYYFKYSTSKQDASFTYDKSTDLTALRAKITELVFYSEIYFDNSITNSVRSGIIITREPIVFLWQSSMTDFGNNLVEKTMYRANVYATKQETSNSLLFGYKTMRRYKSLEDTNNIKVLDYDVNTSIANQMDLNDLSFNLFSINTFEESGMSFPLKENNFLYIQFLVKASGRVELNALEVIYKDNRRLKSIG